YDILFFWVARMMMLGLFCTGTEPFETVYLHGMIRAEGGAKMGKTKGNTIDPLALIEEIGADALRFALVAGSSPGHDLKLTRAKLDGGRNFSTKLWNAARFVLGSRPADDAVADAHAQASLPVRWLQSRLADAVERATRHLDALDLGGYAATVYDVAWSDYCDWFLEMAKVDLRRADASPAERVATWRAAAEGLAMVLRLLHPLMPFVTEELWHALGESEPELTAGESLLITARWPSPAERDDAAESAFDDLAALIRGVRNLRTEAGLPAGAWIELVVDPLDAGAADALRAGLRYIEALARVRPIALGGGDRPELVAATPFGAAWLRANVQVDAGVATGTGSALDATVITRRAARLAEIEGHLERVRRLLADPGFSGRAPETVVARERERLAELEERRRQLLAED
ncbi:MAG: class I tRNA ligase family protein, partial [Candidatus Limnocylindria bacterium]